MHQDRDGLGRVGEGAAARRHRLLLPMSPVWVKPPNAQESRSLGAGPPSSGSEPVVGRGEELAAIEAAVALAGRSRTGHCLAVGGGLGLGKSRLLSELEGRAESAGALVLAGRGRAYEAGAPYGVLVDALDDHLRTLDHREVARLGDGCAEALASIFGVFESAAGEREPVVQAERYRAHRALRMVLARLGEARPLRLQLDDLHWADAETAELVGYLVRHPPRARVLLAIAYRPAQVGAALADAIERGRREGRCDVLELAPLTEAQAAELLASRGDPPQRDQIVRESGGNPLFLEQLARMAATEPRDRGLPVDGLGGDVPKPVIAALEGEFADLGASERDLLGGGSVAGEPFDIDLAAAAAGLERAEALTALDGLLARDLVRPTDSPLRFAFRHPLVHRAVYQTRPAGWRVAAHGRVWPRCCAARAPRSWHWLTTSSGRRWRATRRPSTRSPAPGTPPPYARRPPPRGGFAPRCGLLPADDTQRRLELLVSLATALGSAGSLEEARQTLLDTIAAMPADQHELRARAATFVARLDQALGRQGEARVMLERTLAGLPDPRSEAGARLELELALDQLMSGELAPMRVRARHVLAWPGSWATHSWRPRRGRESPTPSRISVTSPPPWRPRPGAPRSWIHSTTPHARRCWRRSGGWPAPRTWSSAGTTACAMPTAGSGWRAPTVWASWWSR